VDALRVRAEAGLSGAQVAVLDAGRIVWITDWPAVSADGSDWYAVQIDADTTGWVSGGPAEAPYLDLRSMLPVNVPASVFGLGAGSGGYLSWGLEAHRSDASAQPVVLHSEDGVCWQRSELPSNLAVLHIVSADWGPAGWIAVTTNEFGTAPGAFWRSTDGNSWMRLPAFDAPGIVPRSVVGSSAGYALTVGDNRTGSTRPNLFFSSDGSAWTQVGAGTELVSSGVIAIEPGFLQWETGDSGTIVRLSADGRTWQDAGGRLPPSLNSDPLFASAGGSLVAVTTEFTTGAQAMWRTTLGGSELVWERQVDAEALLANNSIDSLASDGSTVLAVGYEPTQAELRMWRSNDGASWTEVPAEGTFGGAVPELVVAADAGFAAVGGTVKGAGTNPVFWHAADAGSWSPEARPVLGEVESPVVGTCPQLPTTMVDWLVVPASIGAECFGDTPISFRGWLSEGGGCGGFFPGTWEPSWLAAPYAMLPIVLTPFEAEYGGCGSAAPHPTLTELPQPQRWVIITGHYNDPAAETCRWTPDPLYKFAVVREGLVLGCRQRFVATAVIPETP
jgi:hypothetical protein